MKENVHIWSNKMDFLPVKFIKLFMATENKNYNTFCINFKVSSYNIYDNIKNERR